MSPVKDAASAPSDANPATPLESLATFCAELRFADLPQALVAKTKVHILDTFGAALAGTRSREFAVAMGAVSTSADNGTRIWGTARYADPRDAALVNGVAAHAFELDDTGGCDHSGAVVLPAVMAALASVTVPTDGRRLISAVVVGYEVGRRVLEAAGGYDGHNGAGWHSTGTCGTIGAAAAVAHLWRLSPAATRDAMSLATSFSSGLWAFIHDGSQAKKIHAGRAAEGGLLAARLARGGLSGPSQVFDDVWGGFFRSFGQIPGDLACFTEGLGTVWKLNRVSLKPYASCRGTHSAVDALSDILLDSGRSAADIARINVRLSAMLLGMCGTKEAGTLAGTQMSLGYALAARCVFGDVGLASYAANRRHDPRTAAVFEMISFEVDPAMLPMDEPVLTVDFADGARASLMVPRPTGSPERPMSAAAITAKFRGLAEMAMPPEGLAALQAAVADLENMSDCRSLEDVLGGGTASREAFI
ncbi:MmgE/PrpD family protein [Aureimonas glaciei]|uniref:2-methylcitrate dehydratase n=1 Tax=Aureimonas glaciei TaxID=1776957 RepID=A0A916XXM1_9HYPH|nr:MmgE/PrpD family protein [Aureimonas glaciei]GGD17778.1 2-methylcitrate dehydratase [Aureimonas glaciei]